MFGKDGRALSPWHTTKRNGRRYRYYIPQRDAKRYAGASKLPRLPAAELEAAVLDQLRTMMRQPVMISEIVPQVVALNDQLDVEQITVAMTQLDGIWDQLFPAEQTRIVQLLVERVIVSPNHIELQLGANGIGQMVKEIRPAKVTEEALA